MKNTLLLFLLLISGVTTQAQQFQWADGYDSFYLNQIYKMFADKERNIMIYTLLEHPIDVQYGSATWMLDTTNNSNTDNAFVKYNHDTVEFAFDCPFHIQDIDFTTNNDYVLLCSGSGKFDVDFSQTGTTIIDFTAFGAQQQIFLLTLSETGAYISHKILKLGVVPELNLDVDKQNNILISGSFYNSIDVSTDPLNPIMIYSAGGVNDRDGFVVKYTSNYTLQWHKELSGMLKQQIQFAETDTANNVILVGSFNGTTDFDPSSAQYNITQNPNINGGSLNPGEDFMVKLSPSGQFIFAKVFESNNVSPGFFDLKIDKKNNILLSGRNSDSTDYDLSALVKTQASGPFIVKYDENGNFEFMNVYTPGNAYPNFLGDGILKSMAIDDDNNYYGIGFNYSNATVDFDCTQGIDLFWPTAISGNQTFIIKIKEDGTHFWGRGLKDLDMYGFIALNQDNEIYIFGQYAHYWGDFDPSPTSSFNLPLFISSGNIAIAKYGNSCPFIPPPTIVSDTVCISDSIHVSMSTAPMGAYYWWNIQPPPYHVNFGNISGNSAVFPPSFNSTYIGVKDSMSNGCYSSDMIASFTKIGPPAPISTSPEACPGSDLIQTIQSTPVGSYFWYTDPNAAPFYNGNSFTTTNVTSAQIYFIKDSVSGGCTSLPYPIYMNLLNTPQVPVFASPVTVCYNDASMYFSLNGATGLQWYVDTNAAPVETAPSIIINSLSDTLLYVRDSTGINCFSTYATLEINVDSLPNFSCTTSSNAICLGDSVTITANGPYTFYVTPSPDWVNGNDYGFVPLSNSVYTVTANSSSGCSYSISVPVDVGTITAPILQFVNNQLFMAPNTFVSRNWFLNTTAIGNNTDTINVGTNGTYSVEVSNSFGCKATATYIVNGLGLNTPTLWPLSYSETTDNIRIDHSNFSELQFNLYSSNGQLIQKGLSTTNTLVIQKRNLPAGVYYLQLIVAQGNYSLKFLIK